MSSTILKLDQITKSYDNQIIFSNLSLEIKKGEVVVVLGPSGCGKSMTLKCIAGIETPDEGRIVLDDEVLFDKKSGINLSPQKRKVGYLFQNYALFPHMTVKQNIEAGLAASGKSKQEKKEIVERLLEQFHIKEL